MLKKCILLSVLPLFFISKGNSANSLNEIVEELRVRSIQSHEVIRDFTLVEDFEVILDNGIIPSEVKLMKKGELFRLETSFELTTKNDDPQKVNKFTHTILDNGITRLILSPFEKKEFTKEEREESQMILDFLLPPSLSNEMRIVGREWIADREAVIIEIPKSSNLPYDKVWMDRERLVPLKMSKMDSEGRELAFLFHDYQMVEGFWGFPYSTEIYFNGALASKIKVRSLVTNTGLSDDLFDPDQVALEIPSESPEPSPLRNPTTVTLGQDATLTPSYNFSENGKDASGLGFAITDKDLSTGFLGSSSFGLAIWIFIPIPFDGSFNYNSGPADAMSFIQLGETFDVDRGTFPAPSWFARIHFHIRYEGSLTIFPPEISFFGITIRFATASAMIYTGDAYGDDKGELSFDDEGFSSSPSGSGIVTTTMDLVEGRVYEPFLQVKSHAQAGQPMIPFLPGLGIASFGGIPLIGDGEVFLDSIVVDFVEELEPPFCKIQDPKYGETVCDTTSIVAVAIDNFAMDSVVFFINGTKVFTDTGPAYRYNWVTNSESDGEHELRIAAVDYFKNVGEDTILVSVNNENPLDIDQDSLSEDYCPDNPWTQAGLLEFNFDIIGTADLFDVQFSSDDLLHQTLLKKIAGHDINFVPQQFAFLPSGIPTPVKAFVQIPIGQHEGVYEGFFRVIASGGCVGGQDSVHVTIEVCPIYDMDIKDDYANVGGNIMEIQAISRSNSEGSEWSLRAFDMGLPHSIVENHDEYDGPGNTPMDCITCEFEEWSPNWHEDDHDHHFHTNFIFTGTGSVMGDSCDWGAGEWRRMFVGLMVPPMRGQENKPGTYKGRLNCWAIWEGDTVDHDYFDVEVKLARIVGPPNLNTSTFGGDPTEEGFKIYWGDFSNVGLVGKVALYREDPRTGTYNIIPGAPRIQKSTYLDQDVMPGITYNYKLGIEYNGSEFVIGPLTVGGSGSLIPKSYALSQNVPNPFRGTTTIHYQIPSATHVSLRVYDLTGRVVRILKNVEEEAGFYDVKWDRRDEVGREAANGIYFYRLSSGEFIQTRKMILLR